MTSPDEAGSEDTRMSMRLPFGWNKMWPSCGCWCTAMSMPAMTLMRDVTAGPRFAGIVMVSRRMPSMRKRSRTRISCGSRWMSLACRATARSSKWSTSRMMPGTSDRMP